MNCPFCNSDEQKILVKEEGFTALFDGFPVSPGHLLIVPDRHVDNYFLLEDNEKDILWRAVDRCKLLLDEKYHPDGYNIGINIGKDAGQSIPHVHIHLIPRYNGDVANPRGGVRGVIPGKQNY
ncbi:MAG: HIT family protein [Bacteroidales bacterium]|nr:HIT family protein [Bacteroidales bacterium]